MTIPIILINLEHDTARYAAMKSQFDRLKLPWSHIKACCGAELPHDVTQQLIAAEPSTRMRRKITLPELGCAISHARSWEIAAQSDSPYSCIMEDDLILSEDLPDLLASVDTLPSDTELIKMVGSPRKCLRLDKTQIGMRKLCFLSKENALAGAYIITRKAAQKALRNIFPISEPLDHPLFRFWENGLNCYHILPYPVKQGTQSSNIEKSRQEALQEGHIKTAHRLIKASDRYQRLKYIFQKLRFVDLLKMHACHYNDY